MLLCDIGPDNVRRLQTNQPPIVLVLVPGVRRRGGSSGGASVVNGLKIALDSRTLNERTNERTNELGRGGPHVRLRPYVLLLQLSVWSGLERKKRKGELGSAAYEMSEASASAQRTPGSWGGGWHPGIFPTLSWRFRVRSPLGRELSSMYRTSDISWNLKNVTQFRA